MNSPFLSSLALLLTLGLAPVAKARPLPACAATAPATVAGTPVISSFSPGYGVPGTVITLTGTDFTGASNVSLNGVSVNFTVVSATTITATVPTLSAATGPLRVATADGTGSSATAFTVVTNAPANCHLNIPLADAATTDIPVYVSGIAGTLGSGTTLTAVDIALFHTWDSDLVISLISPAGQVVLLSSHNGGRDDNYGDPFDCPASTTHFTDAAPTAIGTGAVPFLGSFRPEMPLSGFSTGSANGVWTLRIADTSGGDSGNLQYVKLAFTAPPADLVVSAAATVPAGTYHNITVTGTGNAQFGGPVAVEGELLVESGGVLRPDCQPLTGPGAFTLAAGATLMVCDVAGIAGSGSSGAVQVTGPRTFSSDANYQYTRPGTQNTGPGLPATVRSLTASNGASLSLTNIVAVTEALNLTGATLNTNGWYASIGPGATLTETAGGYLAGLVVTTRNLTTTAPSDLGGLGLTLVPDPARPAVPGSTTVQRITGITNNSGGNHSIRRYYVLQPGNNIQNATLTFSYADTELAGLGESDLSLFRSTSAGSGTWQKLPTSARDAAANTVTVTGMDQFKFLTLASAAAPLPVELVEFTARRQGDAAVLRWTTAQEKNNARFEVEYSTDGRAFQSLGAVTGQGTTNQRHDYQFADAQLLRHDADIVYYRLRQVDQDGTATYSPVQALTVASAPELAVQAWPNPFAATGLRLRVQAAEAGPATVTLTDAMGRSYLTLTTPLPQGTSTLELPQIGQVSPGMYVLRMAQNHQQFSLKVTRQ